MATSTKTKGVFQINGANEVTQNQFAGCVECICERLPLPAWERLMASLPVVRQDIHSGNSSKCVDYGGRADGMAGLGGVCQAAPVALQRRRVGGSWNGHVIYSQCGNGRFPGKGV